MVRIDKVVANDDIQYGKFYFIKGKEYFARTTKKGDAIIIQDESGKWYPIFNRYYTAYFKMKKTLERDFACIKTIYVKDFKEAKEITG